jgi:hypothetical protein
MSSVLGRVQLDDEPPGGPIHWLAEFLKNLAEFLFIIAPRIIANIPTTKEEAINMIVKGQVDEILNEWAYRVISSELLQNRLWYVVFVVASIFATIFLAYKLLGYLLRLALKTKDWDADKILRGMAGIESPVTYLPFRYLPAAFVIITAPVFLVFGILFMNDLMLSFAEFLYGDNSLGRALYDVLLNLLTLESMAYLWVASPIILVLVMFFAVEFAVVSILIVVFGIWMMFIVAKYGDGKSSGKVITDSVWYVFRLILLMVLMKLIWLIGPLILGYSTELSSSIVWWLVAWLVLCVAFPFIYIWIMPRVERVVSRAASSTVTTNVYNPRTLLLDPNLPVPAWSEKVMDTTGRTVNFAMKYSKYFV